MEITGISLSKFKNVTKWFAHIKATAPGYEFNESGTALFKTFFDDYLK